MKKVFLFFFVNLIVLTTFAVAYYILSRNHFTKAINGDVANIYDYILLATGVQSGAGVTTIYPTTNISKLLVSLQLLSLIATNIIIIYVFINFKNFKI
jgi:hypothetical protein